MFAAVFIFMVSVAVFVLCMAAPFQSHRWSAAVIAAGSAGTMVPIFVAIFLAMAVPMLARKPSQPVNYPRIEHLRIAGKYAPANPAKIGVSPLRLQ
jgi:hypothetical protein